MLFLGKLGGNRPKESLLGHTLPRARLPTRAWYGASWFRSGHLGIDRWSYMSFKFDQIDLTVNVVHFYIIPLIVNGVTHVLLHPVDKSVWIGIIRHWRGCRVADISQNLQHSVCLMTITVGQGGHFLSIQWTSSNLLSLKTYGDHLTKCTLTIGQWLLWGAMVVVSVNNL